MSNITTDFITATKKIHADVRVILTTLHLIREDVKTIRDRNESDSDKQPSQKQTGDSSALDSRGSVLKTNQPHGNEEKSDDDSSNGFQGFKERWKKSLIKPIVQIEIAALIGLGLYTCETRRTNNLTQQALHFQRDSIAAEITIGGWDVVDHIVPNKQIGVHTTINNVGHTPAFYGIVVQAFRWTDLPDDFPLIAPEPNFTFQPTVPSEQSIYDVTAASEEFIYNIPHVEDLRPNLATHNLGPPLPRPTVFFVGRFVYDSLDVRTDREFCFFLLYRGNNVTTPISMAAKTDNRFMFVNCPKWNQTTKQTIR